MSDLGAAKGRVLIDTKDFNRAVNEVRRGSELMTKALAAIGVGVSFAGIKQLGQMAFDLAESAANANRTKAAFDNLAAGIGQDANEMLSAMRTASRGMVSDADLVLSANRAMLLGVADNTEKLTTLLDIAGERGQAMGLTLTKAFDDLVTGLGRAQPEILDNLGIQGGGKALLDYANSVGKTTNELTNAQRQAVLFNHVLSSSKPLLDAAGNAGDDAATKFEQMGAKLENTKQKFGDFLLAAGATDTLDTFSTAIDKSLEQLNRLDTWLQSIKDDFNSFSESTGLSRALEEINTQLQRWDDFMGHLGYQIGTRSTDPYAPIVTSGPKTPATTGRVGSGRGVSGPVPIPAGEIDQAAVTNAQVQFGKDLAKINRDTNRQILDAERDYGRQRAETIRSYELGIVREEEDFQRARARQQRDYEANIVQIMRDAQKRDARIRSDLDEQIADLRQDSNKRLAEQEKDFQKQRERAQRDHGDRLLDAAGRLDAKAVYEEQRRFAQQQQDAAEDHKEQMQREADNLAERIAQDQKAAERQLQDARDADTQRLEEMRAALEQQRADEDDDRKTRRERAADDYQYQLDQQAIEQGERIQQIMDDAAEERAALQDAFNEELIALGLHNVAVEKERKRAQDAELEAIAPFMKDWFTTVREAMEADRLQALFPNLPKAILPTATASGAAISASSRSIHIGDINISGAPNMSESQLKNLIINAITEALEQAA